MGFEATPDMLSITGMTLEQFADLMTGLGYKGEKAERVKVKVAEPVVVPDAPVSIAPIPEGESVLAPRPVEEPVAEADPEAEAAPVEMETFYTFSWAPKPRFQRPERTERPNRPERPQGDRPQGDRPKRAAGGERPQGDRPKGDRPKGDRPQGERRDGGFKDGNKGKGGKPDRRDGGKPGGAKAFEARPPRVEKPIDPDNPFAVLAALKTKS